MHCLRKRLDSYQHSIMSMANPNYIMPHVSFAHSTQNQHSQTLVRLVGPQCYNCLLIHVNNLHGQAQVSEKVHTLVRLGGSQPAWPGCTRSTHARPTFSELGAVAGDSTFRDMSAFCLAVGSRSARLVLDCGQTRRAAPQHAQNHGEHTTWAPILNRPFALGDSTLRAGTRVGSVGSQRWGTATSGAPGHGDELGAVGVGPNRGRRRRWLALALRAPGAVFGARGSRGSDSGAAPRILGGRARFGSEGRPTVDKVFRWVSQRWRRLRRNGEEATSVHF